MKIVGRSFNEAYAALVRELFCNGHTSISRKGAKLTELYDQVFTVLEPMDCWAHCRNPSLEYLKKEFDFYMSGSNSLEDAVKCSKFWEKCSDDGKTINSNYGKLLFWDKNDNGNTQFQHAVNCLKNNKRSKKAVMTLYDKESAYISNDNPCTMSLRVRIDEANQLHMTAYMRSSDVYFGLPYDVPWFIFVQLAVIHQLKEAYPTIIIGTYTHIANSLHFYERNRTALEEAIGLSKVRAYTSQSRKEFSDVYDKLLSRGLVASDNLCNNYFMALAWKNAEISKCSKKQVGCCITHTDDEGVEIAIAYGFGGIKDNSPCESCVRDDKSKIFYGDACHSVHAEMRAVIQLLNEGFNNFSNCTMYCTHGPCDACYKLLDYVGLANIVYDVPYKADASFWKSLSVAQARTTNHA